MGVYVKVIGDHSLNVASRRKVLEELQDRMGEKLSVYDEKEKLATERERYYLVAKDSTYFTLANAPETGDSNALCSLFSNHFICHWIEIYKGVTVFHFQNLNIKLNPFMELYFSEENTAMEFNMQLFRLFVKEFLWLTGGTKIIVINDGDFVHEEDMIWDGASFSEIEASCRAKSEPMTSFVRNQKNGWLLDTLEEIDC